MTAGQTLNVLLGLAVMAFGGCIVARTDDRPCKLAGRVVDRRGEAIDFATVALYPHWVAVDPSMSLLRSPEAELECDANGSFVMQVPCAGGVLIGSAKGHAPQLFRWSGDPHIELVLDDPAVLEVNCPDCVAEDKVQVCDGIGLVHEGHRNDGTLVFPALNPGEVTIVVLPKGQANGLPAGELSMGRGQTRTWKLVAITSGLKGEVTVGGYPAPFAKVSAGFVGPDMLMSTTTTDIAGRFSLRGLMPGRWNLIAESNGGRAEAAAEVFSSKMTEVALDVRIVRVEIHVVDGLGRAIGGAVVRLEPRTPRSGCEPGLAVKTCGADVGRTDETGSVTLIASDVGPHRIVAMAIGFENRTQDMELTAGARHETLQLRAKELHERVRGSGQ